jgi:hypothetical protein
MTDSVVETDYEVGKERKVDSDCEQRGDGTSTKF